MNNLKLKTVMKLFIVFALFACSKNSFQSTIDKINSILDNKAEVSIIEKTELLKSKEEYKNLQLSINYFIENEKNINLNEIASVTSLLLYQEEFKDEKQGVVNTTINNSYNISYTFEDLEIVYKSLFVLNTFLYGVANLNRDSLEYYYYQEAESINDTSINELLTSLKNDELLSELRKQDSNMKKISIYQFKEFKFNVEDNYRYLEVSGVIEYSEQNHRIDLLIAPESLEILGFKF
jgi:hypothetical protein